MNLSNNNSSNNNNNNGNNDNNNIKEPLLNNNITTTNNNTCESNTDLNTDIITNSNNTNSNPISNSSPHNNSNSNDPDMISPIIMAKFLEDELKASQVKHCDTCQCSKQDLTVLADVSRSYTVSTQTPFQLQLAGGTLNEPLTQLCLRCHSNLNSPSRTNSPYLMKLVKSSDSVISETKSSVSDLNDMDKLFTPAKKDDLMVNPILGHHRLCDRTAGSGALQHQNSIAAAKLSTTLLYPTTHLGTYGNEKYLLETSNSLAAGMQVKNGFQRRFLEGGGTALELLNAAIGSGSNATIQNIAKKVTEQVTPKSVGNNELDDEAKPLLSASSQSNLLDYGRLKPSVGIELAEPAMEQQMKSPASVCSASEPKQNLMKSGITGSENSLWSRTSSCEGAKMFETFNRNLIKTIKAENPKNRGPRLCAMRIQHNGQSNILLDNIESMEAVTPIIYKRRERLLDEELDDIKDIITSNATNISSTEIVAAHQAEDADVGYTTDAGNEKLTDVITIQADALENNTSTQAHHNETDLQCGMPENEVSPNSCVVTNNTPNERLGDVSDCRETFTADGATAALIDLTEVAIITSDKTAVQADQLNTAPEEKVQEKRNSLTSKSNVTPTISVLDIALAQTSLDVTGATQMRNDPVRIVSSAQQMQKPKHTSIYHSLQNESGSKTSHNSKSCTQSSSISDAIDIQESIMLRRQQLNRVAEWVQSNTQQLEQQQQQQQQQQQRIQQQQQALNSLNNCDSSGGTDRQSSFSTLDPLDSVSMEKLSMDSGYKTTPQPHTNGSHQPLDDANKSTEDSLSPKTDTNSSLNNNNYKNSALLNHFPSDSISKQLTMHVYPTNTYFRRTTRSGLPVAYTTPDPNASNAETFLNNYNNNNNNNSACSTTPTLPDQPTCDILNYKYYPSDTDKTRAISAELHTTTKHVDIAQMEYNVKQFLLKQNEWSMRTSNTRGGRGGINTSASNLSSANSQVTLSSQRTQTTAKTLRHLKLFSGVGVGPGLGARVQPPLIKDAAAAAAAAKATGSLNNRDEGELKVKAASANDVEGVKVTAAVAANALPQRTETNL
nr:hybrid signal transduction histidine kinase L-like [Bactrocera oleae]